MRTLPLRLFLALLCGFTLGCRSTDVSPAAPVEPAVQASTPVSEADALSFEELPCGQEPPELCLSGHVAGAGPGAVALQSRGVPYSNIDAFQRQGQGWGVATQLNTERAHPQILESLVLEEGAVLVIWSDWVPPPASAGQSEGAGLRSIRYDDGSWSAVERALPGAVSVRGPRLVHGPAGGVLLSVIEIVDHTRSRLGLYRAEATGAWTRLPTPIVDPVRQPYEATPLVDGEGRIHLVFHTREVDDVGRSTPSNVRAFHAHAVSSPDGVLEWSQPEELTELGLGGAERSLVLEGERLHATWYDKVDGAFGLFSNQWEDGRWSEPSPIPTQGPSPTGPRFVEGASPPQLLFAHSNGRVLVLGRRVWREGAWQEVPDVGPLPGGQLPRGAAEADGTVLVSWTDMPLGNPKVRTAHLPRP